MGPWYRQLGRGAASAKVSAEPYVPRGRSRETTFQENLTDWARVEAEARGLGERVAADLKTEGRAAVRVMLKVRYAPFETHTASTGLPEPTAEPAEIAEAAAALTARFDHARAVRLLGVRAEMTPPPATP
jgi:DNA polymerase-4